MSGTVEGSRKAVQTIYERHGRDFFAKAGRIGGKKGTTGGFAANRELARIAGKKGGMASHRGWTPEQRANHAKITKRRSKWYGKFLRSSHV